MVNSVDAKTAEYIKKLWLAILIALIWIFLIAFPWHFSWGETSDEFAIASLPIETPIAWIEPIYVPSHPKLSTVYKQCSCVLFARALTGFTGPVGLGKNWPIDNNGPKVGGVVVFTYNHVAVIQAINGDIITLSESNYIHCQQTFGRTININDTNIIGFWSNDT